MQIIQDTTEFVLPRQSAAAIGKFDGIHLGHRRLLETLSEQKDRLLTVIFTFDPPPEVLFGDNMMKGLMTKEEKRNAFARMGIDVLIEFPLNKETASIMPERFVREYLVEKLRASYIAAGTDLSFGNKGMGNAALLQDLAKEYGYHVNIIDKVSVGGEEVSSTLIRRTIAGGDMEKAADLLGAPYQINGTVSHGRQLGRRLGMPTVNLLPPDEKLLPPNGVYYSDLWLDGKCYRGISNVGYKPTVSDIPVMGVETYLYDFDKDVYGREVVVELLANKRPEMRFESVDALKAQVHKDITEGARFHENGSKNTGK